MKRFLSILLSVMLLMGSLTVTVFAAPELTLVATNQLAGISSAPFADAGKYVLFNKIDGATYYVNGEEATVDNELRIDTPLNKADYVALKVANAGPNVFTAELDGVASNSVSIYGVQTTGGTIETSSTRFTSIDVEAIEDAELKEALSQRENVGYFPAYNKTTFATTPISTNSSATGYTYDGTSTKSSSINLANMQAYRTSTSVYINDTTIQEKYIGLFNTASYYHRIRTDNLGIYVNNSSSTATTYDTGFNASYKAWNDFELVVYEYTLSDGTLVGKPDLYFNDILIAKTINRNLSGSWSQNTYHNSNEISGQNVYHTVLNLSNKNDLETIPYYPTLTAVADDENDTVIVTGTDVDEFVASQYTAKVFVNDAPTEDEVVINAEGETAPTSISVPVALTNAKVYVAFVDENNNVLNAFEPVKTAELTYETIDASANAYNPSISATIDEANDTITVYGKDLEEYDSYTAKIFVNGTATTDEVTVNAEGEASPVATHITSAEALTAASVYVALVDAEGNIAQGLAGDIKTETFTFETIAPTDIPVPLELSINTSAARVISGTLTAEAGKKVLFNEITLTGVQASTTVKYFHNGFEVADVTSPVEGTVALPVSAGLNTYVAKRFDASGNLMSGTESNDVYVNGLALTATKHRGVYANNAGRFNAQTSEETPELYGRTDVVKVGTHSYLSGKADDDLAANAFTAEGGENEYIKYSLDAYYNLVDGKINGSTGSYGIMAAGTNNSDSAYKHHVLIFDDGSVKLGLATDGVDSGMKVAPGQWHSFELCLNKSTKKLDLYVDDYLVITNWRRSGSSWSAYNSGVFWFNGQAATNADVYLSGDYRYYYVYDYEISGNASTGEVVIPKGALLTADQSAEIGVFGRKADNTVVTERFTFGSEDTMEIDLGSGISKIFVWTWDDLKPLCDVIE